MAGNPKGVPGPATSLPGPPKPVAQAAVLPGTMKLAAPGSGSQGGGGGGGGGPTPLSPTPLITWPTITPPSWYTGPPKNLNQLASLIRNAFFAGLGDLSGFPYNAQIVQGGTIELTWSLPGYAIPAGMSMLAVMTDPNGNVILNKTLQLDQSGDMKINLGATFNVSIQYSLAITVYLPATSNSAVGPAMQVTWTGTGNTLYSGILLNVPFTGVADMGSVQLTVTNPSGTPLPNKQVAVSATDQSSLGFAGAAINGSTITNAQGVATIPMSGNWFFLSDSFSVGWTIDSGASDQADGTQVATGAQLAAGLKIPVTLQPPGGTVGGGNIASGSKSSEAGSVLVEISTPGVSVSLDAINVQADISAQGGGDVLWTGSGSTNSGGAVGIPVSGLPADTPENITVSVSVSKKIGTGKGRGGSTSIVGSYSVDSTLSTLAASGVIVPVKATVE